MDKAKPKLTLKQRKWLDAYIETGNATEACRRAGYAGTDESLSQIGHENLRKLEIPVTELLDRMGLNDAALARKLEEGLDAHRTIVARFEGAITDMRDFVDYETRFQYLEMAFRLKGRFPQDRVATDAVPEALALLRQTLAGKDNGD